MAQTSAVPHEPANHVLLRGALLADPTVRDRADGEQVVDFRILVERAAGGRTRADQIDCAAELPAVRRAVTRYRSGDVITVTGELHRRFWRSGTSLINRCEVEASSVRLIRRAGQRSASSAALTPASA